VRVLRGLPSPLIPVRGIGYASASPTPHTLSRTYRYTYSLTYRGYLRGGLWGPLRGEAHKQELSGKGNIGASGAAEVGALRVAKAGCRLGVGSLTTDRQYPRGTANGGT
jgi:hypothetical protein